MNYIERRTVERYTGSVIRDNDRRHAIRVIAKMGSWMDHHPEALARILVCMENWISASGVQTRNPFSYTAYVKITRLNYVKETPKFVQTPQYIQSFLRVSEST